MKVSYYNHYIPQSNVVLFYNSLTGGYLVLKKSLCDMIFKDDKLDIEKIQQHAPSIYKSLLDNGFIVEKDLNESLLVENLHYEKKFSKATYELIINSTLDCNLKCWYCYEGHIKQSRMSEDIIDRIIKNIENKYKKEPFKLFYLKFFGGEPIMQPKVVFSIIERVRKLAKTYDFELNIHFTTNGTIIPEKLLKMSLDCNISFQITFDGNKKQHDSVRLRKFENYKKGTYERILKNIKRISAYTNCYTVIRINFSENTFDNLETLIDDLDFYNRKKIKISLHKVWQVDKKLINQEKLFNFIRYANSKDFIVQYMSLYNNGGIACYADKYNQAVINYDGSIYKCTARNFDKENCEGYLNKDGLIIWNTDKLMKRLKIEIAEKCRKCSLLPSCPGVCSQRKIENNGEFICALDNSFSISEYIIQNFNNQILLAKLARK